MDAILNETMSTDRQFSMTQVIQSYSQKLKGFLRGKVKSNEDAEDILQEVWYQFSKLTSLDEIENISGWLFQIARNKVIDLYRKKSTSSLESEMEFEEEGETNIKEILLMDDTNNPELSFFKETFWEALMKALDELPTKQREVFVLNELDELTLQEIADQQGENIKTIISRKGYAVKFLREKLNYLYKDLNL